MFKLLLAASVACLWMLPGYALADSRNLWPCTLLPSVCTPPPPITTAAPWFEANAANAVTVMVFAAIMVIATRRHRWEASASDRIERRRSWSQPPSFSDS